MRNRGFQREYNKYLREEKEREKVFEATFREKYENFSEFDDNPKIEIYDKMDCMRRIKLNKWVEFHNDEVSDVFKNHSNRQFSRLLLNSIGLIASFVWLVFELVMWQSITSSSKIPTTCILPFILLVFFLVVIINTVVSTKKKSWYKRDAVVISAKYMGVVYLRILIKDNDEAREINLEISKDNILCTLVEDNDRVLIGKPYMNSSEIYILKNLDAEEREIQKLQLLNSIKRK